VNETGIWGISTMIMMGKLKYSEKNLSGRHSFHHKSYLD